MTILTHEEQAHVTSVLALIGLGLDYIDDAVVMLETIDESVLAEALSDSYDKIMGTRRILKDMLR